MDLSFSVTIGFIAATLTTVSFVPQLVKTVKTKETKHISLFMYIIFTIGVAMWVVYGVLNRDIPVILANSITLCFISVILFMKIKHG